VREFVLCKVPWKHPMHIRQGHYVFVKGILAVSLSMWWVVSWRAFPKWSAHEPFKFKVCSLKACMSNSCFDTIFFHYHLPCSEWFFWVPFHDFQPFQQISSSKIPQFGLSYCALKEEFTNIIHGHNNWHDHTFLDGTSSIKIHTTCLVLRNNPRGNWVELT
jgi:hypothetical protein